MPALALVTPKREQVRGGNDRPRVPLVEAVNENAVFPETPRNGGICCADVSDTCSGFCFSLSSQHASAVKKTKNTNIEWKR
jgi:hypothetical protein